MDNQSNDRDTSSTALEPKKTYERPMILSEEIFETLALACGKANGPLACTLSGRS